MDTYAVLARKHLESVLAERDRPAQPDPLAEGRVERRRTLARTSTWLRARFARPAPARPLPSPKVIPGH